ncbi:MAG: DUF86 domain-containing protein [Deltaproteobacteria bacterium]|nr:DUF86 domain-containing protein [Deltaproteobacteria bacterium]
MKKNKKHFDLQVIEKKLITLDENIAQLEKIRASLNLEDFLNDTEQQWSVEHGLQLCIQQVIDLGSHLLVSLRLNNIEDYSDVGTKLGKHGILEKELSKKSVEMIKFRNLLIHEYIQVKPEKVFGILKTGLSDLKAISTKIKIFIQK